MTNNSIVRKHIVFYGYVQGVGFRYRARHAADLHGCTGWVRNEWDGSVTMEVQGQREAIDMLLECLKDDIYIRIEDIERTPIPIIEDERKFKVTFV